MSICLFLVPKPRDISDLEKVVPSSVAEAVRKEVGSNLVEKSGLTERKRGTYDKVTPEKRANIAKYAAKNGIAAAIRHFKTKEGFSQITLKESTVRGWKKLYWEELSSRKRKADDRPGQQLPLKQTGRPLLLGRDVEESAKKVIQQIRQSGGNLNNSGRGRSWAVFILRRMGFVQRRGSTQTKAKLSDQ